MRSPRAALWAVIARPFGANALLALTLTLALALCATTAVRAETPADEPPTKTREIFVPVSDLKVLLESELHRVLLTRQEYDELVKKAKRAPEKHVPRPTVTVSSDYDITVDEGRARLHGTIAIDVLEDGLHAVPLDFGGVGLLAAKLDDQPAPIGYASDGRLNLLVSGQGRHKLALDMVAPLEMNSAQQCLSFRLTGAAVGRWQLTVPGDVEIKSGADVVSRKVDTVNPGTDKGAKVTRFELLPRAGDCTILMSLNSHLQRREQAVASRCVLFDEVTEAYEKLHATVTFWILHRAVDRFRFVVPEGFEITEINSPLLARWDIATEAGRKIVNVRLREQTTETVVLSVAAVKTPSRLKPWHMPRLELLDVVGQVTVLGLLVQNDLKAESLTAGDLIPVDTAVLATALPATLLRPEPSAVPLRYIAAYYAPQGDYELKADFSRVPATLAVTTNLLLSIREKGCEVQGGFALLPAAEKRFAFDFSVPAGWNVLEVTGPDKSPLVIERETLPSPVLGRGAGGEGDHLPSPVLGRGAVGEGGRVHVKLPQGIAPGQIYVANFRARFTPPGWLSPWKAQAIEFPMFRVAEAQRDEGAVAVAAEEDLEVRPEKVDRLVPITAAEMARFGLTNAATNLAYRYEGSGAGTMYPWSATIAVERTKSRATARTFAFFQIVPEVLKAHYVVIYTIEDAKTRRLALLLPASTPESLAICGLDGVSIKESTSEPAGTMRRWNVLLDEARRGEVRLAVDFEMRPQTAVGEPPPPEPANFPFPPPEKQKPAAPQPDATGKVTELKDFALPLVKADAVVYQSGLVAIEGDLELGVDVKTDARRADVGQLAIAGYTPASLEPSQQPGNQGAKQPPMRLLGTYDFVGETPKVAVDVVRNPSYALTPAIVQRARLATLLSADGTSQTQATFQLRTKAPYLEVELPKDASLWSAVLDGTPLKPQKRGGIRLIGLPPGSTGAVRSLQLVYEAPVQPVTNGGRLNLAAPRLLYRGSRDAKHSTEIPLVNIEWTVTVPDGYEAVATDGTLEAKPIARPMPAPLAVAGTLYELAGGVHERNFAMVASEAKSVGAAKSPSFYAPTRPRAAPSQDNMIRSLEPEKFDKADIGEIEETPPTEMNVDPTLHAPAQAAQEQEYNDESKVFEHRGGGGAGSKDVGSAGGALAFGPGPNLPDRFARRPKAAADRTATTPPSSDVVTATPAPAKAVPADVPAPTAAPAPPAAYGTAPAYAVPAVPPAPPPPSSPNAAAEYSRLVLPPGTTAAPAPKPESEPARPGVTRLPGIAQLAGRTVSAVPKPSYQPQNLSGFRSLKIDVDQSGMDQRQLLTFNSLGATPQIGITLARRNRTDSLVWGIALAVFLLGVVLTTRPVRQKVALVLGLGLASAVLPLAWDTVSMAQLCNGVFYAASLLVPYYLLAGLVRWIVRWLCGLVGWMAAPAAAAAAVVLALVTLFSANAQAQSQPAEGNNLTAERVEYLPPVVVPDDAIIVPYDVKSKTGIKDADHLLVPYDRYVELWNLAHPDKKDLGQAGKPDVRQAFQPDHPAPLPYALSGAAYSAVLAGEETLNITGLMQVNVMAEGYVSIPLNLRGGVLARAELDGKPAPLKVVSTSESPNVSGTLRVPTKSGGTRSVPDTNKASAAMDATLLVLQVSGKGTHKLELEVRLKLAHVGGWRGTSGTLPTAPAATVTFRVPQPQTEVRLGLADETIETALGPGGALQLQWRPKVAEGQVDRGLTVETASLLDVQEDGLRMALHLKLEFRRSQREAFILSLPADYLVEKVAGSNVRGWEVKRAAKEQTVEVSLLKTAKDSEQFNLFLSRGGKVGQAPLDKFAVPMVTVRDAALSTGQLTIRRSPLLDVRTTERVGLTRTDLGPLPELSGGPATEESVLAIRPYEAYHFPTTPFVLRLSAAPIVGEVTAEAQTSVKLDTTEPGLEGKIIFHVGQRRTYRFELAVPEDLRLPEVTLPSGGIWSIEKEGPGSPRPPAVPGRMGEGQGEGKGILKVRLQQGVLGDWSLILRGKLPALDAQREMALPKLEVLGVKRQEGDIAVQADPAFNVQARELRGCQETELERVAAWLDPQFRAATRLALHYAGSGYAGKLRLTPRTPEVVCDTVSNVRIADPVIEETIILNYSIHNAGIHELTFLLPASMADARISTPMLRRKTIAPVDPKVAGSPLRVRLELQGDAMNDLRVLVENDRLLTPGSEKDPHTAPLPTFEAAGGGPGSFVRHQYIVLEKPTCRDELLEMPENLQVLSRQQQQWQNLTAMLGVKQLYEAYLIQPGAAKPRLGFYLKRHEDLETAGARIDLAQTTIVVDANGAYRAKVELSLDNSSEQFLDVELPDGATLWTVHVAGEPVKPAQVPGARDARHVLLPVRKTAKGDPNYLVVLKYGGRMRPLSLMSAVEFPLVRNVKPYPSPAGRTIGIEQTQVELYVPKSHQWFDFGGTMHSTQDEADLRAGRLAAFNKEGQRLIEATHAKDLFVRARAKANLKNWGAEAETIWGEAGRVGIGNKGLQSQLSANASVTEQAKEVLKSGDKEQQEETTEDNRQRLNELYQKQVTVNAGNTLTLSGNNSYSGGTTISGGAIVVQNDADFNPNWITRNNLDNNDVAVSHLPAPANGPAPAGGTQPSPFYLRDDVQYSPPGTQVPLTRQGGGALTLGNGANAYSGPTTINSGVAQNANPNFVNGRIILNNDPSIGGQGNSSNASPTTNYNAMGGTAWQSLAQAVAQPQMANPAQPAPQERYSQAQTANAPMQPNAPAQQAYAARGAVRNDQHRELAEYQEKLSRSGKLNPAQGQGGERQEQLAKLVDQYNQLNDEQRYEEAEVIAKRAHALAPNEMVSQVMVSKSQILRDPSRRKKLDGKEKNVANALIDVDAAVSPVDASGSMLATAVPTAPMGLASLDFELPTDKTLYELYRFTTPRGEAELTARTVTNSTLTRLELLLGIAAASLLIWAAFWVIRRGVLRWFRHPLGAILLAVAGLAMFCGSLLPFVGLIALLTGIALLVAYFWHRRAAA